MPALNAQTRAPAPPLLAASLPTPRLSPNPALTPPCARAMDTAMLVTVLKVAFGGAIGASLRYLSGVAIARAFGTGGFPLGVIFVNILGSFLMGFLVVTFGHKGWSHLNPLVMTGILGGFTTFSSFSLEAWTLFERGQTGQAAAYVLLSVAVSLAGLVAGVHLGRSVIA